MYFCKLESILYCSLSILLRLPPIIMLFNDFHESDPVDCKIYNRTELNALKNVFDNKIWLMNFNIRSFHKNSDEFYGYIDQLVSKPDIYCLTETWFSNENCADVSNYEAFHTYRDQRTGGGISLFVKSNYKSVVLSELSYVTNVLEVCTIKVNIQNNTVFIVGVYRPPNTSVGQFELELGNVLTRLAGKQIIIAGDLNIYILNPNNQELNCMNSLVSNSFRSFINLPTRSTDRTASCIDHIWGNVNNVLLSGVIEAHITDHIPCFVVFSINSNTEGSNFVKTFRDFSERNMNVFGSVLRDFTDDFVVSDDDDINMKVAHFLDKLFKLFDSSFPIRRKCISHNRALKPWITDQHIRTIDRKFLLFRQYKLGHVTLEYYNNFKNMVTGMLRRAKSDYFSRKFDRCSGNPKSTWKLLNTITSRKQKSKGAPSEMLINGVKVNDPKEIAEAFNDYFSEVGKNLEAQIPIVDTSPLRYMGESKQSSFFAAPSTPEEVEIIIKNLNCHSGQPNTIPHKIFLKFAKLLSKPIADLFNGSISRGIFPDILKIGRVIPIFKSGSREILSKYRPITLLMAMSKIFEKLMYNRLNTYLEGNNILSDTQFGFRKGKNTEDAVLEFLDNAYMSLNNSDIFAAVYLDLSKAFDTVKHSILMKKLYHLGVRGTVFDWFKSYLSNRITYVSINNTDSSTKPIKYGVPQGSNLGPLLFLLYINDMKNSSVLLNFINFADDTTAYVKGSDMNAIYDILETELGRVSQWLHVNRLSLNIDKTNYMIITNKKIDEKELRISGRIIKRATSVKFLGVTIDDRLSFAGHVRDVTNKISSATGMLNRVSTLIPKQVKFNVYFALIHSRLSYAVTVWGGSSRSNQKLCTSTLNRAWRLIFSNNGQVDNIESKLLNFESLYKYFTAVKTYNILKNERHGYFRTKYIQLTSTHNYSTRFNGFNIPFFLKTRCRASYIYNSVKIYNQLSDEIRNAQSIRDFKKRYRDSLLRQQRTNSRSDSFN